MKNSITIFFIAIGLSALGQPKSIHFKPRVYYNNFSHKFPAVLKVQQGDTIKNESVDTGGSKSSNWDIYRVQNTNTCRAQT
jgi:acetamidase/formamidase